MSVLEEELTNVEHEKAIWREFALGNGRQRRSDEIDGEDEEWEGHGTGLHHDGSEQMIGQQGR